MTDRYLKAGEAAERLGVSKSTLARWRKEGRVPYIRAYQEAKPRYREADIEALLVKRQEPASSSP